MHSRSRRGVPTAQRSEKARAIVLAREPLDVARDVAGTVGILAEELDDERACTRMLRTELGAAQARIAELEAQLDAARLALAIRDSRSGGSGVTD